jgi:eukaryotic-like serine/threonine-protein kinase
MRTRISHYQLGDELGRGGMGIVYRALDTRLGRPVAIKVLPEDATADSDRHRRFVREARAASALNHPHIVTIYDIDEEDGTTFIAMELVEGTPLAHRLAEGPLPLADAVEYGEQIAAALQAAHAAGIVHRDIKPANIVVTPDGRAKVLDFGLAKLVERAPDDETRTSHETRVGVVVGTAAYMSPEQAEGLPVDGRTDIFSLGAVLYEMLTGRRAFEGGSELGLLTAVLREDPVPIRALRSGVPERVSDVVHRCLAKKLEARYADAAELRADLAACRAQLAPVVPVARRRALVLIPVVVVLVVFAALLAWQRAGAERRRWAVEEALPEIERLQNSDRPVHALLLAREAEQYAPDDLARLRQQWIRFRVVTEPPGAEVAIKAYMDPHGAWEPIGTTPISEYPLPVGQYRLRVRKDGFVPVEIANARIGFTRATLTPRTEAVDGMVKVPGGEYSVGIAGTVDLPDFWIGRFEVTNREFKQFVDAGGYRDPAHWQEPFDDGGRVLSFEEAMARFTDATGRSGPATWELGSFPAGHDDLPVAGVSWYEAAAYARFVGGSLPTIHHWYAAAGIDDAFSSILRLSNFESRGPVPVGSLDAMGVWGTYDMAGNVKEWCLNLAGGTTRRHILGGGFNEPSYMYVNADAHEPWGREPTYGLRLMRSVEDYDPLVSAPVARVHGDPNSVVPEPPAMVDVYARLYQYDRAPLNARLESVDESSPHWRRETVSFDAAYGGERVTAYLFVPRHVRPPYQTVLLFPSAYAVAMTSSSHLDLQMFEFLVRSGRALLYPVYQGTFERRNVARLGPMGLRDLRVQQAKDVFRAVDYLESRPDIDTDRLAYYSLSMGASFGPIPLSLEPRIRAAVLLSAGLRFNTPPEIQPANFAPRVRVPVLMVNGRDDFDAPLASQRRFFDLFGTPAEAKRHVILDGGHVPSDMRGVIRVVLDWLDEQFGPADTR